MSRPPCSRAIRVSLLLTLLALATACPPTPPAAAPSVQAACSGADLPACEKAMLTGKADALLGTYAKARGDAGWLALHEHVQGAAARPLLISAKGAAPKGFDLIRHDLTATSVPLDELVWAATRGSKLTQVFVAVDGGLAQLFPADVLEPHMLGLPAVMRGSTARLAADAALAGALRAAVLAARRMDYLAAASAADRLRKLVEAAPPHDESTLRARYALVLLDNAGVVLADSEWGDDDDAAAAAPLPPTHSAYADYLAVKLSTDSAAAWSKRNKRIVARLSSDRVALLDAMHGPEGSCPTWVVPPMDRVSDLAFSGQLALALDADAAPNEKPGRGQLTLEAWLARYEKALKLMEQSGSTWAFVPHLLRQRGEHSGLSAAGTNTYRKLTELTLEHVAALSKLAAADPARFQAMGVVTLVYQPGVLGDRRVMPAVRQLVERSVTAKIHAASDVSAVFEAGVAAFAAGISYPEPMRSAQFGAVHEALSRKLSGPFGRQHGWGVAGLHGAQGVLSFVGSGRASVEETAGRMARSLDDKDLPFPGLAKLATAAAHYATLGAKKLDATVANPQMFPAERADARKALGEAIATLAPVGPASAAERELNAQLAGFADGVIAALVAWIASDADKGPQCASDGSIGKDHPLRNAFDRLRKKRRAIVDAKAFVRGDSIWLKRARLLALLLSDGLDVADKTGGVKFVIAEPDAQRIVEQATTSWSDEDVADAVSGLYLIVRSAGGEGESDQVRLAGNAIRVARALAKLFGEENGSPGASLFGALTRLGARAAGAVAKGDLEGVLVEQARAAYADGATQQGDLFLMVTLGASLLREGDAPDRAIALAKERKRPVYLPLLLYGKGSREGGDPSALAAAMRDAVKAECSAPDLEPIIAVRKASYQFRQGERDRARSALEEALARAERRGLVVPRQNFEYRQLTNGKRFNLQQTMSLGGDLLKAAGSFQVGLGFQRGGSEPPGAQFEVTFADPADAAGREEAARYYAHAAALTAVYHFVVNDDAKALSAARRAVEAWANGVRLGTDRIAVGGNTSAWVTDARAVVALTAQLAAERGHALLAGDLWTLLLSSMGIDADDDSVKEVLAELPATVRGIEELTAVTERARRSMATLTAPLKCTERPGDAEKLQQVSCERYPLALSLRVAGGLSALPRLKSAVTGSCPEWKALSTFLRAAEQRRYEPDMFLDAVEALRKRGRVNDAATLLARQRHPRHCTPRVVSEARTLSKETSLGVHIRADLLSVVANCDPGPSVDADLAALDELTRQHALPARNFELLVFASRLALSEDRFGPLYAISTQPDFVKRWLELGPDLATAALLINHAAAVGSGKAVDSESTLPFYRLLCTTFPTKARGTMCNSISLLRGAGAVSDKRRAAKNALAQFVKQGVAAVVP